MHLTRRQLTAAFAALMLTPLANAQGSAYPTKPIKIVYTYAAGGTGDSLARTLADSLGEQLGQPAIVDNRTGANGAVGTAAVARATADGYTLLLTTVTSVVSAPLATRDATLIAEKAFEPIANLAMTPLVLLAHPSVPADDFPGFVTWARQQAGGVDFGTAGATIEVSNALLARGAGIKIVNVSYRGAAPALQALLGGEVKVFLSVPSAATAEFVKAGKIKVLGVSSADPSSIVPGATPIRKYVPGYVQDINFALWAPRGTPREVRAKLEEAVRKMLGRPELMKRFAEMGTSLKFSPPEEVTRITQRETQNFNVAIETAGVKIGQ